MPDGSCDNPAGPPPVAAPWVQQVVASRAEARVVDQRVGSDDRPAAVCPLREAAPIGHLAGDGTAVRATAAVFQALGHPVRLQVVGVLLRRSPATRVELTAMLEHDWPVIEYHLTRLRAAGLVTVRGGPAQARYALVDGLRAGLATLCGADPLPCPGCPAGVGGPYGPPARRDP